MAENEEKMPSGEGEPLVLGEPEALADSEPKAEPVTLAPSPEPKRGSGLVGGVLGGLVAAGLGFGLAQYVPNGWPVQDTSALQAALTAQQQMTADLQSKLDALPDVSGQITALDARIAKLESQPAGVSVPESALQDLQAQIDKLRAAPVAGIDPAAVQAVMADAEASAAKIKAEAEATAAKARAKLALAEVQSAIDSGAPYAASLAALGDVPAALRENADSGLPSLPALIDSFPAAARAAIDSDLRANMGQSWTDRATNFLRTQTGARSTGPREGSDADAVLSRAEAALRAGDLKAALTEISALSEPAQAEMAAWRGQAEKRLAGIDAVAGLAASTGE